MTTASQIKIRNFHHMVECFHDQTINGHVKSDIWTAPELKVLLNNRLACIEKALELHNQNVCKILAMLPY